MKIIITITVLVCVSFLFFSRLGEYALWDDEATCALYGQSVWRTGDTNAVIGHNLIAYNFGRELQNLRMRYIPPLQFYIVAPFVGLFEGSAFLARFPFALCGLFTVVFMLLFLWRWQASINTWILTSIGILGNVSLMLFSRQCRYYSLAILMTTILIFLYSCLGQGLNKRKLFAFSLVSLLLLASNYICYIALFACLIVDYFFWGRKVRSARYVDLAIIFIPQLVLGSLLLKIYNPIGKNIWDYHSQVWLFDRLKLFFMNLRDLNSCELGVGILILIAPFLYFLKKERGLLRGPLMILVYIFTISLISPQPATMSVAFVRYLAPLIPVCIFTAVLSIQALTDKLKWLAIPIAMLAFGTNVFHGGPLVGIDSRSGFSNVIAQGRFRSTVIDFIGELISPPKSAYRITADWINRNLKDKDTVLVLPGFANYPLMHHAPKAIYAWQLKGETGQFKELPEIHFEGKVTPDYIIAFGPHIVDAKQVFQDLGNRGVNYTKVKQIDVYWYDLTRPELFWHSFRPIKNFSREFEAIYIFKRNASPI